MHIRRRSAAFLAAASIASTGCNPLFGIEEGHLVGGIDASPGGDAGAAPDATLGDGGDAGDAGGGCTIGGALYAAGQPNPANACETCNPTASATQWTAKPVGTECGGGKLCNGSTCAAGCFISGAAFVEGSANPANECQTCQPAASATAWTPANGKACGAATEGTCAASACILPASCAPAGAGRTTCGAKGSGTESCCASPRVPGGTFFRTYTNDGTGPKDESDPTTLSSFRLDKYAVTVGRFRRFVAAYNDGSWTKKVTAGSGKHAHLNGGRGLENGDAAGTYESGWVEGDNGSVSPSTTNLQCDTKYATWTDSPAGNENRPINCVTWFEAVAFCIWDGGFLPSDAELAYAAAGGDAQLQYPWGSAGPGTECPGTGCQYTIYDCRYPGGLDAGSCSGVENIANVGFASLGVGRWGQFDLAGNMTAWARDVSKNVYANPCTDCAWLSAHGPDARAYQGCYFRWALRPAPAAASYTGPIYRNSAIGLRCARTP